MTKSVFFFCFQPLTNSDLSFMIMITIIIKEDDDVNGAAATVTPRNTRQKSVIESVVLSSCDHPTALAVCERVREEIPNVSLGTVYRVLGALVREGKVREIAVPGAPSRFDKTTRIHAHFFCTECGGVSDVNVGEEDFVRHAAAVCPNAEIDEAEIIFKGLCPDCKEKKL